MAVAATPARTPCVGQKLPTAYDEDVADKKLIGSGSFGDIFLCRWKGRQCALKVLRTSSLNIDTKWELSRLIKEIKMMHSLTQHGDQFVQVLALYISQSKLTGFLMEYCKYGSFRQVISHLMDRLPRDARLPWLSISLLNDICIAMRVLQEQLDCIVLHGDLALENILITADLRAKIADFGLSRHLNSIMSDKSKQMQSLSGIERRPPEQLIDPLRPPDEFTDRYQFGICTVEAMIFASIRQRVGSVTQEFKDLVCRGRLAERMQQMVNEECFDHCRRSMEQQPEALNHLNRVVLDTIGSAMSLQPSQRQTFGQIAELWSSCLSFNHCIQRERQLAFDRLLTDIGDDEGVELARVATLGDGEGDDRNGEDKEEEESEGAANFKKLKINGVNIDSIECSIHRAIPSRPKTVISNSRLLRYRFTNRLLASAQDCKALAECSELHQTWMEFLQAMQVDKSVIDQFEHDIVLNGVTESQALCSVLHDLQPAFNKVADALKAINAMQALSVCKKLHDKL